MNQRNHQNNWNNKNNQNRQTHKNGLCNQHTKGKERKDNKVPMRYQTHTFKDTNVFQLKYDIDGTVEKTTLTVYEDRSDEAFLKMFKKFQNYVNTYKIWNEENAARTVYRHFRRCLAGAARDLWDQINALEDEEDVRDELTFIYHLQELISSILGDDAFRNQKDYLKNTPKPERMTVKQWINRLKNVNSYLPLMHPTDAPSLKKKYSGCLGKRL
jgi:hypothetical protein